MDGFVLTLWLVRLLFLALLYVFLFAVVRVLLRDLRSAARGPVELGRLVVVASPRGEPIPGAMFPLDAVTTIGRDVNNGIVVDDPFASDGPRGPHLPGSGLVRRGPRQHQRDLRERGPGGGDRRDRVW